jgi:hypothetical protein
MRKLLLLGLTVLCLIAPWPVRAELFDFDTAPVHTSLPVDLTVGAITAHFYASGLGFSIQSADVMGSTPAGFAGLCLWPNSVFAADLSVSFSVNVSDFSILFSPQELGCDDSATMRVTAYANNVAVGTNTAIASPPGTWPTGTLAFSSPQSFDRVVIHYDRRPPTCQDWGPIFMVDNMTVTRSVVGVSDLELLELAPLACPNPFESETSIRLRARTPVPCSVTVHDVQGHLVRALWSGTALRPDAAIRWDGRDQSGNAVSSGIYLCRVRTTTQALTTRMVLVRR